MQSAGETDGVDPLSTGAPRHRSGAGRLLVTGSFLLGSAGLLVALAADAIAVAGRHLGVPFLGSIETVQAAVIVAASSAMVAATLGRAHATVHILTGRLSVNGRRRFQVFADRVSASSSRRWRPALSGSWSICGTAPRRPRSWGYRSRRCGSSGARAPC